jgi:hypothetical protein
MPREYTGQDYSPCTEAQRLRRFLSRLEQILCHGCSCLAYLYAHAQGEGVESRRRPTVAIPTAHGGNLVIAEALSGLEQNTGAGELAEPSLPRRRRCSKVMRSSGISFALF